MDGFTDNFNTGSLIVRNNIAMNNARYNYILRTNPYKFPSSILLIIIIQSEMIGKIK